MLCVHIHTQYITCSICTLYHPLRPCASWSLHKPIGIDMRGIILGNIAFNTWFLLLLAVGKELTKFMIWSLVCTHSHIFTHTLLEVQITGCVLNGLCFELRCFQMKLCMSTPVDTGAGCPLCVSPCTTNVLWGGDYKRLLCV